VFQKFFPRLSTWRQALDEEFCQESFGLGLRVDDSEPSLGGGEDQGFPLDFCPGGGGFPTPDEVS
jgi:hypothetical protein